MVDYGDETHSRQSTVDEDGKRVLLFPEDVKGIWRNRRTIVYYTLIAVYLILPWIYIGGDQSIRLNLPAREFTFFGSTFYAHNAPMVLFMLTGFIFSIGFITSIWGRVWCGWACPQTVFIDSIYLRIEKLVEGNARKRMKLNEASWNFEKIRKKGLKWFLFTVATLHISHTFIGYFVGTRELLHISTKAPTDNLPVFITMLVITGIFLVDFGWFREQFCIIACPYGRLQSVMMDDQSKVVLYDDRRGEPRRKPGMKPEEHGDCIDCHACVKVCPTGIDIRMGVQLECIACTQCIDACDDIMLKTKRAPGLIRYGSAAEMAGKQQKTFSPRNIAYFVILIGIVSGFIYSLNLSQGVNAEVLRGLGTPFKMRQERVINHFQIILDQSGHVEEREVLIEIADKDIAPQVELKTARNPYLFKKNHARVNVFAEFMPNLLTNGSRVIHFHITDKKTGKVIIKEVKLVGPIK
jgi:cytochrome c oxidase accessory protein FixG